jgi:hypothetical protein
MKHILLAAIVCLLLGHSLGLAQSRSTYQPFADPWHVMRQLDAINGLQIGIRQRSVVATGTVACLGVRIPRRRGLHAAA